MVQDLARPYNAFRSPRHSIYYRFAHTTLISCNWLLPEVWSGLCPHKAASSFYQGLLLLAHCDRCAYLPAQWVVVLSFLKKTVILPLFSCRILSSFLNKT